MSIPAHIERYAEKAMVADPWQQSYDDRQPAAAADAGQSAAAQLHAAFRAMFLGAFDDPKLDTKATFARMKALMREFDKLTGGKGATPQPAGSLAESFRRPGGRLVAEAQAPAADRQYAERGSLAAALRGASAGGFPLMPARSIPIG